MSAVWFRLRAELRTRWRALFGLTLLIGLSGGLVIAAVAGARRTDSANTRLFSALNTRDVAIVPDQIPSTLDLDAVERLPQVADAARLEVVALAPRDVSSFRELSESFGLPLASQGRWAYRIDRLKILEGRMPHRRNANEVLVNPLLARQQHVEVGDIIRAVGLSATDLRSVESGKDFASTAASLRAGTLGKPLSLRVVGIGISPEEIVVDDQFATPRMVLTPEFLRRYPKVASMFGEITNVRLRGGAAALPGFQRTVEAMATGESISFQTSANTQAKVDRAVQPQVGVLSVFAIVIALAGLLVIGQAIARYTALESSDTPTLWALGSTRGQLFALAMLRAALAAAVGALVAVTIAVALSPLTPIGPARTAEPYPGLAVDSFALGAGAVVIVLAVLVLAAVPAWQLARNAGQRAELETTRPSRLVGALAAASMPPPAVAGVRLAVERGRGRTAVPVRTTIVGAVLAVAMVMGAVVFATSLQHLVSTPRLYGWNWDARVNASGDTAAETRAIARRVVGILDADHAVGAWAPNSMSSVRLPSGSVTALGLDPRAGAVSPTVANGRLPNRDDEIALGASTLDAAGVTPGDTIFARANDGSRRQLRVVGRVVLPGLGLYPGADKTSLGEGAVVTRQALRTLGPKFGVTGFLIVFRDDAGPASRERVLARIRAVAGEGTSGNSGKLERPSDIVSYEQVGDTPFVLAGILALLATATVSHALVTSVRRRRRDLALLATLGFTRRQVSAAVAWQATTVGVVALIVGVPLGIVIGRSGWNSLAENLGTVAEPVVPVLGVLLTVPVVLLLVNLVAFVPGRMAARLRPAVVLRAE
jgi:hypothetical protein